MHLTTCDPAELGALLPSALAGEAVLAPVDPAASEATLAMLRPEVAVAEPGAALVVATSGSTGTPKGVVLSRDALVAASESAQQLTGPLAWHLALPAHYVAGAMVLVRAAVARTPVVTVRPDLADLPRPTRPTAISIVPTQLHRALSNGDLVQRLAAHQLVLLGGAAPAPGLVDRARAEGINVTTTYGMSETCGGCVWDGVPLPGVDALLDADDRISLRGAMAFSGYRLRPDLTADVLVDEHTVRTNDRGDWRDGLLSVLGRLDDVVISGGVNVDLAAVTRAAQHLTSAPVLAIGVPDAEWGTRVVLASSDGRDLEAWRDDLRARLEAAALPRQLVRLAAVPRTSSGKIDRQALMGLATQVSTQGGERRGDDC